MVTIDRHGALHDNLGKYAEQDNSAAGYDLAGPLHEPAMPTFGDDEYDRQLGEIIGTALTRARGVDAALTRARQTDESDDEYAVRVRKRDAAVQRRQREIDAVEILEDRFGSIDQAVVHLGESVAQRAEQYAGITADEVRDDWAARTDAAQSARDTTKAAYDALQDDEQHNSEYRAADAAWQQAREEARERHGVYGLAEGVEVARAAAKQASSRTDPEYQAFEAAAERLEGAREQVGKDPFVVAALEAKQEAARRRGVREAPLLDAYQQAARDLSLVEAGTDEVTKAQMRRLADAYVRSLEDVRDMGGAIELHPKSKRDAVAAFGEAMRVFPADWVDASNKHAGTGQGAPIAKVGTSRAHYAHVKHHKTRKKVQEESVTTGMVYRGGSVALLDGLVTGRDHSTLYEDFEWIEYDDQYRVQRAYGDQREPLWRRKEYEVAGWDATYGLAQGQAPRGRGWEQFTDPDTGYTSWRRPKYAMQTVETTSAPEITTNVKASRVEGASGTFSTCVHEASHRFESTVPGIMAVEDAFVKRRATDVDGNVGGLSSIYTHSRSGRAEKGRDGGFVDKYVGKEYTSGHREVLSMGAGSIFGGSHGGLLGIAGNTQDLEHRAFVLGTLAGAGKRGMRRRYAR